MTNQEAMMRERFEEWLRDYGRLQYPFYEKACAQEIANTSFGQTCWAAYQAAITQLTPALVEAREALRSAEYAIKGREHTGFIDKALATLNSILGEAPTPNKPTKEE